MTEDDRTSQAQRKLALLANRLFCQDALFLLFAVEVRSSSKHECDFQEPEDVSKLTLSKLDAKSEEWFAESL